jgi:hypothetical protein
MRTAPPIWRRLLVGSDITLSGLHDLLQLAMGWTNSHMHEFQFRGQCYGSNDPERGLAEGIDERKVRLNQLLVRVGAKIVYTYDFGDSWEHAIVLEKCLPVDPNMAYPACTGGRGACPPEDCGGVGGSIICWRHYRIPVTRNTKNSLNGRAKTTIREDSLSRQSTASCMEKSARPDLQVENMPSWPYGPSADGARLTHTRLPKGHDYSTCS